MFLYTRFPPKRNTSESSVMMPSTRPSSTSAAHCASASMGAVIYGIPNSRSITCTAVSIRKEEKDRVIRPNHDLGNHLLSDILRIAHGCFLLLVQCLYLLIDLTTDVIEIFPFDL